MIRNVNLNINFKNWPEKNEFKQNLNLNQLKKQLEIVDLKGYSYIIRSLRYPNENFIQLGSGPNFQGGLVTLCTCKHQMRTWKDVKDWKDLWVIGVSNLTKIKLEKNYLVYMMKISESYISFNELWNKLPNKTKTIKNTRVNIFGDVYQPKDNIKDFYDHKNYYKPINAHSHSSEESFTKDISYMLNGRRPALLIGDPDLTFIWSKPIISLKQKHIRGNPFYKNKVEFFKNLD